MNIMENMSRSGVANSAEQQWQQPMARQARENEVCRVAILIGGHRCVLCLRMDLDVHVDLECCLIYAW